MSTEPEDSVLGTLLADPGVSTVVCVGSGGVGKTTTAAALGVHAAQEGRRVAVLTIDPARRLAQALGADAVGAEAHRVPGLTTHDGRPAHLDVLLLDMRRTFDDVVRAHAAPDRVEEILTHPLYESLASSLAGTQEYMAMERLGQLHEEIARTGRWDLLVVDTPPSRSALDFLDAPARLGGFLDGRLVRVLSAPGRVGLRVLGGGLRLAKGVVGVVLGPSLVGDVQVLLEAMDSVLGGFRRRAEQTYATLTSERAAFVVVTSPEVGALAEAEHLVERLARDGVSPRAVVVNRVVRAASSPSITDALRALELVEDDLARAALRVHVDRSRTARRHRETVRRLRGSLAAPVVVVPDTGSDVHDLDGLAEVAARLVSG